MTTTKLIRTALAGLPDRPVWQRLPACLATVLAVITLTVAAGAQTIDPNNEGYDPMRQISSQFVRPNLLVVLDVSGSMAWDLNGNDMGVDCVGFEWWVPSSNVTKTSGTGCSGNQKHYFKWLKPSPSRMATVKNALGNSVPIYNWTPPAVLSVTTSGGVTWTPNGRDSNANSYYKWTSDCQANDPGFPFLANQPPVYRSAADLTNVPGSITVVPPGDLVGKSASRANWGLEIFASTEFADCSTATLRAKIDTADNGDVSLLEAYLTLTTQSTTIGGISYSGVGVGTYTPTRGALNFAKTVIQATAAGGTFTDKLRTTWTVPADPKLACGRVNGVILVTDGMSNRCNPNSPTSAIDNVSQGNNWQEPCCATRTSPPCEFDVGGSGIDCPSSWDKFAAQRSDELWSLTAAGRALNVRTWVIGVSPNVGPCEVNYIAYKGRTDASSLLGDAGFDTASDPRLPPNAFDTYVTSSCAFQTPAPHEPPGGEYAYFANTSDGLRDAFSAILAAVGAGDYTTAAPTVTSSPTTPEGLVGFVSSATYPTWKGHLYAYDLTADCSNTSFWNCIMPCGWVDPTNPARKSNCLWDAGDVLSLGALNPDGTRKAPNNGLARKLYSWDPTPTATSTSGAAMIAIDVANVATLNTLCGNCGINAQVIDFMKGNNGALTGTARAWKLGSIINSTQAVIGPPVMWKQDTVENHTSFEETYSARHEMVWAGSSDGFIHGFDVVDGAEIVALIPPELLAKQVKLYQAYVARPSQQTTGEPKFPDQHIYGVANSPRFADVWFPATSEYKTMLFVTDGPGGSGVAAIDVTHPFPGRDYNNNGSLTEPNEAADPNYGWGATTSPLPVQTIWSKNRGDYGALGFTWSVPALGATDRDTWELMIGGGFDDFGGAVSSPPPTVYRISPVDGSLLSTETLANQSSPAPYVRNQAFADAVLWKTAAPYFQPDNIVNQGVQADLNGQVWGLEPSNWNPSSIFNVYPNQPIYYSPAVAAYPSNASPTHRLYAFASGTFYERSPNVTGKDSTFVPTLYIGTVLTSGGSAQLQGIPLTSIPKPTGQTGFLGRRAQVTAPPMVFVAKTGSGSNPFALFLVYDPDAGTCVGTTFIIRVGFDPTAIASTTVPATNVYSAGSGASAGFAIAGRQVIVSHSYVGENGRASLVAVPNLDIPPGDLSGSISWWMELQ